MQERPLIVTSEEVVQVSLAGELRWRLTIEDLVFVGEYTTSAGPQADDYFLEFITVKDGLANWFEVTFYADGLDEAIEVLGRKLGQSLLLELYSSTDFKSRVVWPGELAGKPYRMWVPHRSGWAALLRALKFRGRDHTLSRELTRYVDSKCRRS